MWKVMEDGKRLEYGMALGSEIIPSWLWNLALFIWFWTSDIPEKGTPLGLDLIEALC